MKYFKLHTGCFNNIWAMLAKKKTVFILGKDYILVTPEHILSLAIESIIILILNHNQFPQ